MKMTMKITVKMTTRTIKKIKIISLAFLTVAASFLSFYFLNAGLTTEKLINIWPVIISFWIFITLVVLEVVLIDNLNLLTFLVFLQSAVPALVFTSYFSHPRFIFWGLIILFLFMFWGVSKGHRVIKNNLKVRFFFISRQVVPKIVTGLLLFTIVVLYINYIVLGNFSEGLGTKVFNGILKSAQPILKVWVPDISFDMKIDKALQKTAETQFEKSKDEILAKQGISIDKLSYVEKSELINQISAGIKERIERLTGELSGNQTISEVLYSLVKNKINSLSLFAKKLIGAGLFLILFFVIKGIAFIIYPLIEITAFVIYKILLLSNFAHINLETKQKEVVNI